jgi:hypothetical protein
MYCVPAIEAVLSPTIDHAKVSVRQYTEKLALSVPKCNSIKFVHIQLL